VGKNGPRKENSPLVMEGKRDGGRGYQGGSRLMTPDAFIGGGKTCLIPFFQKGERRERGFGLGWECSSR